MAILNTVDAVSTANIAMLQGIVDAGEAKSVNLRNQLAGLSAVMQNYMSQANALRQQISAAEGPDTVAARKALAQINNPGKENPLMVSLAGAVAAQPFVTEIDNLNAAVAALSAAAGDPTCAIWRIDIQVNVQGVSQTISIADNLAVTDSQAILFDIRNILGQKAVVQTNALGAIT